LAQGTSFMLSETDDDAATGADLSTVVASAS
jgi:hypothetical protein